MLCILNTFTQVAAQFFQFINIRFICLRIVIYEYVFLLFHAEQRAGRFWHHFNFPSPLEPFRSLVHYVSNLLSSSSDLLRGITYICPIVCQPMYCTVYISYNRTHIFRPFVLKRTLVNIRIRFSWPARQLSTLLWRGIRVQSWIQYSVLLFVFWRFITRWSRYSPAAITHLPEHQPRFLLPVQMVQILPLKFQHLRPPPPQSPPLLAFYYISISLLRLWLTGSLDLSFHLSIPMFQCVFCVQQTTQKPSLSEAFIKLQFSTAVGDVRRFNYVVAVRLTLILRLLPDPIHYCRWDWLLLLLLIPDPSWNLYIFHTVRL